MTDHLRAHAVLRGGHVDDRVLPVRVGEGAEPGADEGDLGAGDRLADFTGNGARDGAGLGLCRGEACTGGEEERCCEDVPEGSC